MSADKGYATESVVSVGGGNRKKLCMMSPKEVVEMKYTLGVLVFGAVLLIGATVIVVGLGVLCFVSIKALRVYMRSKEVREEKAIVKQSLGEVIKRHREECKMTQEFVAEAIGVSRQAVSKWENGTSDPSTSNLIAIAKVFQISPEELLQEVL